MSEAAAPPSLDERALARALRLLQARAFDTSYRHGFHDGDQSVSSETGNLQVALRLFLIVGEVVEAFDEVSRGRGVTEVWKGPVGEPKGVPVEIADVVIRCLDFCHTYGIDLVGEVLKKMDYNETRPHKHGKRW